MLCKSLPGLACLTLALNAWSAESAPPCAIPADTVPFEFSADGNLLRGFIDVPPGSGKHPAILILHGSGATDVRRRDVSYNGSYDELRAAFRAIGVATVVWDRAGTGCSVGKYVHFDDVFARADETVTAFDALKARVDLDPQRIGLWAISQGVWAAEMAAVRRQDIAFLVLVSSPATDFYAIWDYQARIRLREQNVPEAEAAAAVAAMHRVLLMQQAGATYEEFTQAAQPLLKYSVFEQMGITGGTRESFAAYSDPRILRIWSVNAERLLSAIKVPVLAIWGDHDQLIDWRESQKVYPEALRRAGNRDVTLKVFRGANHNQMQGPGSSSGAPVQAPFVEGYVSTMTTWLRKHDFASR